MQTELPFLTACCMTSNDFALYADFLLLKIYYSKLYISGILSILASTVWIQIGPRVSDSKKIDVTQSSLIICAAQDKSKLWLHVAAIVPMSLRYWFNLNAFSHVKHFNIDKMTPSPAATREINLKRILPKIYQVNYSLLANIASCYI